MSGTVFFNASAELATLTNTFDVNGAPADPTTVTLAVTDPAGVTTAYSYPADIFTTGTGTYTKDIPCSAAVDGIWTYVWTGTGDASDVVAGTWTVSSTALNRYYCSAEELKSRLQITGSSDDSEIMLAVAAASRAIDGYCERYFYRVADTRTYVPDGLYRVKTDDLVSVTTLATDPAGTAAQGGTFPVTWPAGSFQLLPYNPGKTGEPWPYTSIRAVGGLTFPWVIPLLLMRMDRVQVAGVFGWPAVPQVIKTMTLTVAAEVFRMKDIPAGGGVAGEFAVTVIANSPLVRQALGVYRRNPVLVA